MHLAKKIIAITGGASGIGKAMAEAFQHQGAKRVVVIDREASAAEAVAQALGCSAEVVDVADERALRLCITRIERDIGPIDLFCSNAGVVLGRGLEATNAEWEASWQINTMAHVYAARELIPRMVERGGGYLLHTSSAAGLLTQLDLATYAVTKHAATAFAEWIAINYGDQGIRVSLLCPQAVRTPMLRDQEDGGVAGVDGVIPPEQVALAVVRGLHEEQFLILPHPQVLTYMQRKTADYDRWLGGMRRLRGRYVQT